MLILNFSTFGSKLIFPVFDMFFYFMDEMEFTKTESNMNDLVSGYQQYQEAKMGGLWSYAGLHKVILCLGSAILIQNVPGKTREIPTLKYIKMCQLIDNIRPQYL